LCHAILNRWPHFVGGVAVKLPQYSNLAIKLYDWLSLRSVVLQPLLHDFRLVVLPLAQRFARYVILALQNAIKYRISCYIISTVQYFIIILDQNIV